MCILAFAYKTPALGPLYLLANRDESYARPTAALDFWADHPDVLGGRDLQAGGSWMAIDKRGRFAAVTHIREGIPRPAPKSRGELVQRFVTGNDTTLAYADWLRQAASDYGPFNLVFGAWNDLLHFNSRRGTLNRIAPGIHVLSNADMDTDWFKATMLRQGLQAIQRPLVDQHVLNLLADRTPAPLDRLPNTGVGLALEKQLSPVFVSGRDYGTRSSSVLGISSRGDVQWVERTWLMGRESGQRRFQLTINR